MCLRRAVLAVDLLSALWAGHSAGLAADPASSADARRTEADEYQWASLPIAVEHLPPGTASVPVTTAVDFSEALERLQLPGAVDERSMRLYRLDEGKPLEEPAQFIAESQPRLAERTLLPGTPPTVSYLGEHAALATPAGIKVAGQLTFLARADRTGQAKYQLRFGVLRAGRALQVPYPPQNLRMFDKDGRATTVHWFPQMQIRPQWPLEGKLHIFDEGQLVTSYHIGPWADVAAPGVLRRPFLYPVNGPDGFSLTEFGKSHDPTGSHAHHYSLWIAHANVAGKDFWSEKGGIIAHGQFDLLEDGPLFCRTRQKTRWVVDAGSTLLLERRELTFYKAAPDYRLIDVDLQFSPAGKAPVVLGKTSFGFLAARVAQSMTVFDGGGEILNANGERNEQQAHLKRAAWIDQSGPIAPDKWNGIAILDHPENPNYPTVWHCRNDGWVGAAFNADNPYTLAPGKTLRLRYRIVLHRHNAAQGQVAQRQAEFSARPVVQLGAPTTQWKP